MVLLEGLRFDSCTFLERRAFLLSVLSCHLISLLFEPFFFLAALGSKTAAYGASGMLRGRFVDVYTCAASIAPDFVVRLFSCTAVPDSLIGRILCVLRVIWVWRVQNVSMYVVFHILFGLDHGVYELRRRFPDSRHSGHLGHPVQTHGEGDQFLSMVIILSVSNYTVHELVVLVSSLRLLSVAVYFKLPLTSVGKSAGLLSAQYALRGGRSTPT